MKKEEIPGVLKKMAERYFPELKYQFGGFYYKESPEIAVKSGLNTILFNEKHLSIRDDQLERVLAHELQHVEDQKDLVLSEGETDYVFAFIFHPNLEDLYKRLEEYYKGMSERGEQLALKLLPLPENVRERVKLESNYASPTEILARLRGYQHYLSQIKEGVDVKTLPYESIEVFKEEDLKLLDIEYRKELASELHEKNPEIFEIDSSELISITETDLPKVENI